MPEKALQLLIEAQAYLDEAKTLLTDVEDRSTVAYCIVRIGHVLERGGK